MATPAGLKTTSSTTVKLLWILVVGAVISVGLGVYANAHTPTGQRPGR